MTVSPGFICPHSGIFGFQARFQILDR
uniref:Uncharacterized protein n=1 Tax=Arundo donax TaxID=35708 RepID=A0A0A9BG74_ARUDO